MQSSTVYGGYACYGGTAMAYPDVSGTGGQLMANGYTESRDRMQSSVEDIDLSSNESGAGLVDVAAALNLDSSDGT